MARFGQALKARKDPQQLSKASAPHNPPLALPSYLPIRPSACFAIVPPHRPFKLFLLGFETATWHVLARPSFGKPQHRTTLRLLCHWASKLLHGTFWPGLKTFKSPAAAFESLSTAQPSACFAIVPPHRPFKLFLLGFQTATWHVLARPSFGKPQHRTTLRLLCHRTSP